MTDYTCAICGTHHDSIEKRNRCESECIKKNKESLKAKETSNISAKIDELMQEIDAYVQKYGATSFMFGEYMLTFFRDKSVATYPPLHYGLFS